MCRKYYLYFPSLICYFCFPLPPKKSLQGFDVSCFLIATASVWNFQMQSPYSKAFQNKFKESNKLFLMSIEMRICLQYLNFSVLNIATTNTQRKPEIILDFYYFCYQSSLLFFYHYRKLSLLMLLQGVFWMVKRLSFSPFFSFQSFHCIYFLMFFLVNLCYLYLYCHI